MIYKNPFNLYKEREKDREIKSAWCLVRLSTSVLSLPLHLERKKKVRELAAIAWSPVGEGGGGGGSF